MRNVIVTGGSRGLGLAIGRRLQALGDNVIAIARTKGEIFKPEQREIDKAGFANTTSGALHFRPYDLAEIAGIAALVKGIRKEFGPIDGLVNNAAIGTSGTLATMRESEIERIVRLNTLSPLVLTKHVLRSMMAARRGRIVNIASIIGVTGFSGLAAYGATKASLVGLTRSLAREVGPLGITVNAIAPGFLDTEMTEGLGEEERQQVMRRSALRRFADIDDVAEAVAYLLGDQAKSITGTVLTIDAGSTA
jgi:3-oxoacyl-[acyl-carrier protein] reductase